MSWSANLKMVGKEEVSFESTPQVGYCEEGSVAAIGEAKKAAEVVILSGIMGDSVNVNMSGHANPNNVPEGGWADDFMTISFSVLKK